MRPHDNRREDKDPCRSEIRSVLSRSRVVRMPAGVLLRDRRAAHRAARGSGFRSDRRPCGQVRRETHRNEAVGAPGRWHRLWSCHAFPGHEEFCQRIEIRRRPEVGTPSTICLAKARRNATISAGSPAFRPGEYQGGLCGVPQGFSIMKKEIRLNAFAMNCVAHQSPGVWTHPRDRTSEYNRLPYWIDLARTLERGRFDGLFLADVLGVYDVFGGSADAALRNATQTPANDPLLLISAMAAVTKDLGFGVT